MTQRFARTAIAAGVSVLLLAGVLEAQQRGMPGRFGGAGVYGVQGRQANANTNPAAALANTPPVVAGSVTRTDAARGLVEVATQSGVASGNLRVVSVGTNALMTRSVSASASDLKVGDPLSVVGTATTIVASRVQIGAGSQGSSLTGDLSSAAQTGAYGASQSSSRYNAALTGTVVSLDPLTVATGSGARVRVQTDSGASVTRSERVTVAELKAGDQVVAVGGWNGDGTLRAQQVAVNPSR